MCIQHTLPYLGPCVRSPVTQKRQPQARPCCPVTRGSNCVFWVLSGTKPQYLPRGRTHVLGDQLQQGGNEPMFWFHLLHSSCLFFHCPVPGGCTRKGPKGPCGQYVLPRCPHHSLSSSTPVGPQRWSDGNFRRPLRQPGAGWKHKTVFPSVDRDTRAGPESDLAWQARD